MSDLKWDVIDLIDALEVLPEEDDYQTHYRFTFERLGLTAMLDLWPWEATGTIIIRNYPDLLNYLQH